jgi:hypothetical protein
MMELGVMVTQCDIFCPRNAYRAAAYREDAEDAGNIRKLALASTMRLRRIGQAARDARCAQRYAPVDTWKSEQGCVDAVRAALAQRTLDPARLTGHEYRILGSLMKDPEGPEPSPPAEEA